MRWICRDGVSRLAMSAGPLLSTHLQHTDLRAGVIMVLIDMGCHQRKSPMRFYAIAAGGGRCNVTTRLALERSQRDDVLQKNIEQIAEDASCRKISRADAFWPAQKSARALVTPGYRVSGTKFKFKI